MSRHQVCERLAAAACDRLAVCEPTLAAAGCRVQQMNRCCPDGVCAAPVIADEPHLDACETAVASASCSDLSDGELPASCDHLTDPVPAQPKPPTDGGPPDTTGDNVLEVSWSMFAGGTQLTCDQFLQTQTIRIVATPPAGAALIRELPCAPQSGLTTLPSGTYSIVAQARTAGGQVNQQALASTVVVGASGAQVGFSFSVTTTLGGFCTQLATAVCNACAPSDSSCKPDAYANCCGASGSCGEPALADPQAFPACLAAYSSGGYCGSTSPSVCQGSIDVW